MLFVLMRSYIHQVHISKAKGVLFKIDFEKVFDRVNWGFLLETLKGRDFGPKWTQRIIIILQGSKTCINFNDNLGAYFHCQRGVRQGNPLSPFFFI
jgi:Reverse transcriptase (RNA-dependent DNA polymerase)